MANTRFVILLVAFAPLLVSGANILGLMSIPSPSHHNWNRHIFYKLAAEGHNLTVLSADVDKEVTPGLHYIWAEKVYSTMYNGTEAFNMLDLVGTFPLISLAFMYMWMNMACKAYVASDGFQTLLNYPNDFKFDLVLVDFTLEPCLIGFVDKFNYPPVIGMTACSAPYNSYDFIGGLRQPSYVPHPIAEFGTAMTFWERLQNYVYYIADDIIRQSILMPVNEGVMRKALNNPNLPSATTLLKKTVLLLTNTHFSLEKMEPLPPNIIPVGGLQIQPPKPLDAELEAFVQRAKKGVVLFSLGTNMKSEMMGDAQKKMFIEAFKHFPDYNFIWKYESDLGLPLPPNVKTLGWVRQNDILGHPKTKAFISHCGLLGTQEAVWYGIPVVGLPFFGDQHRNIRGGIKAGTSVKLDYMNLSEDSIRNALQEVLGKPEYYQNAQRKSKLFRDQPQKPIDRALFWIEWVLRHKDNYEAIQLPIRDQAAFVSNSYDVILTLLAVVVLTSLVVGWILKKICCRNRKQNKAKKQ